MSTPPVEPDWNTRNKAVIEAFRANNGRVPGAPSSEATLLLLHTVGARTGQERVTPLMSQPLEGGRFAVFASKGGSPSHPDWFHNLRQAPTVTVEIGSDTLPMQARVAEGDERERIWARQTTEYPQFAEYERKTPRQIPVVVLEPLA